jgi:hypothetical protein
MMRASLALVLALGACSATSLAATKFPEQKAKLEQQLKAQFVPTTVNPDGTFGTPGTVLVLRKPDLGAVPGNAAAYYTNSLKDGRLTHPALANIVFKRDVIRTFPVGSRFYVMNLGVKDDAVVVLLFSCTAYGGMPYKADVQFPFPKGYLADVTLSQIQAAIGEVFSVDWPAPPPSAQIVQQFREQYPLTRVGTNGVVVQAGTVLVVHEDGLKAIPASYQEYLASSFTKGAGIKMNGAQQIGGVGPDVYLQEAGFFQVGEKAYLTKVEVKPTEIVFSVQSCGACNPAAIDPTPFRASLAFQFVKGYLTTADFKEVQETIGRVFAIDNSATGQPASTAAAPQPTQPAPTPVPAAQPQQTEPPTITIGQTKDQVIAALGQPDRAAKVGKKEICFYKDMKITFVDGKVSNIQ